MLKGNCTGSLDSAALRLGVTVTGERLGLPADRQPVGETVGKPCLTDFVLRSLEVVFDAPLLDDLAVGVEDAVGGAPVAIARLADAAGIDEIFFPGG